MSCSWTDAALEMRSTQAVLRMWHKTTPTRHKSKHSPACVQKHTNAPHPVVAAECFALNSLAGRARIERASKCGCLVCTRESQAGCSNHPGPRELNSPTRAKDLRWVDYGFRGCTPNFKIQQQTHAHKPVSEAGVLLNDFVRGGWKKKMHRLLSPRRRDTSTPKHRQSLRKRSMQRAALIKYPAHRGLYWTF